MFRPHRLVARSQLPEPALLTAHVLLDALVRRDLPTTRFASVESGGQTRLAAIP
jgi:hypothetical protein